MKNICNYLMAPVAGPGGAGRRWAALRWLLASLLTAGLTLGAQAQTRDARPAQGANPCYPAGWKPKALAKNLSFSSTYGGAFTPRGSMKILVIFAGFTESIDSNCGDYNSSEWPQVDPNGGTPGGSLPANLRDHCYTSNLQFRPTATNQTLSNYLYQMSRTAASPLKVTFGFFPERINIRASGPHAGNMMAYQQDVLDTIKVKYPDFDWSPYDQRTNDPWYGFDNSTTGPDGKLDYVVICFRPGCGAGLPDQTGIASVANVTFPATSVRPTAYSITTGHGMVGWGLRHGTFLHELAHTLFCYPHQYGANGTTGDYFYNTTAWGMMQPEMGLYAVNAWERWYLGWTELQTSNGQGGTTSSDIQDANSLTATNGYYTLRDYTTTGDVARIKLPNAGNQYLWLENHAKAGPCDRRIWQQGGDGLNFLPAPSGLLAMVEDIADRDNYVNTINGLKTVSAQGSYDYIPQGPLSYWNGHFWGNAFYDLGGLGGSTTPTPNPAGGQNLNTHFRWDVNGDGVINYDPATGNNDMTSGNEWTLNARENGSFTDGLLAAGIGTRTVGFRYGLDGNPMLIPHQKFNSSTQRLAEIPLSGLSVEVTGYDSNTGAITIRVRYDNISIGRDTRWTGELRTYPVANTTWPGASVQVNSGYRLTVDRSATAQRSTPGPLGDFVNDTRLTVSTNTRLALASCAKLDLTGAGTTLYVEQGGSVYVSGCAQLTAYTGTTVNVYDMGDLPGGPKVLKVGSTLIIRRTGQVIRPTRTDLVFSDY